jgi:hypothetical protein
VLILKVTGTWETVGSLEQSHQLLIPGFGWHHVEVGCAGDVSEDHATCIFAHED